MSWQANDAVRRYSKSKGTARLLMIMLSNYAGAHGEDCRPGLALLASDTRLNERTIRNLLVQLRGLGELIVCYEAGPKRVNVYWLNLPEGGLTPPPHILQQAVDGAIWPPRRTEGEESSPSEAEEVAPSVAAGGGSGAPPEGEPKRTQGGKTAPARGITSPPDPSVDPPGDLSGDPPALNARARPVRSVLRPRERAAAERADCPLWAAMARAAGGEPVAAGELVEWEQCRRDALAGDRDPAVVAADFEARAAEYRRRWAHLAFSVPAVFRNWTKLAPPPEVRGGFDPAAYRALRGEGEPAEQVPFSGEIKRRALTVARDTTALAERAALLERLETDDWAQALWQEDCRRPPRLGLVWATAIFVPPNAEHGAALVFPDRLGLARARASPGDHRAATARIQARHRAYAGPVALVALGDLDEATGGGDDGGDDERADDLADEAAGAAAGAGPGA